VAAETSQTLDRGLRTIGLLADAPAGLTPTELAGRLGVSRPVVYRLLTTLMEHGYARRDADGRAFLGLAALRLGRGMEPLLRAAALPVLRSLAEEVGATAHLAIADGSDALAIAVVEPSWTDLHVAYRVGSRHPLDRGAAGQAILAARRGAGSGYSVSESQLQRGAFGIAAAVPGLESIEASVGVVALQHLDAEVVGPLVVKAAAECAHLLA
jgi:DNA-binding IclR family transcriptional regulator